MDTTVEQLTDSEKFFYENANYSFDRKIETQEQGRIRSARELAHAEQLLNAGPYFVDFTPDSEPWDGDVEWDGPVWIATLYSVMDSAEPKPMDSLSGIGASVDDPYLRVVAAELASQNLPEAQPKV